MHEWQWHWPITCDFLYKKGNKKRLFLLHIEVDSRSSAANTVLEMISVIWFVPFL